MQVTWGDCWGLEFEAGPDNWAAFDFRLVTKRKHIEPVFGQIRANRRLDRFQRRGRAAVRSEWRLITATHNLLKLHHH